MLGFGNTELILFQTSKELLENASDSIRMLDHWSDWYGASYRINSRGLVTQIYALLFVMIQELA